VTPVFTPTFFRKSLPPERSRSASCIVVHMKLYSDFATRRTAQVVTDLIAILSIAVAIWLGIMVFQVIKAFSSLGADLENAGAGFRETMVSVGETLGGVPLIGGGIRAPFDQASGAGQALEAAGQSAQVAVGQLAVGAGIAVALLPIVLILAVWFLPRLRFTRRATSAHRLVKSGAPDELLALRALTTRKMTKLIAISPDVVGAWRDRDPRVVRQLAALELRAAGVRLRR
jgi:hypothetical protein